QVLLDNLLVFWLLLSLYLATSDDRRILTPLLSGLALGVCVITKENAIFFVPVIGYLLYGKVRQRHNYRFALGFWLFTGFAIISLYFLYAVLKNELLPSHFNFNLNTAPADHVSLLYFYVLPLVPFLAMNICMLVSRLLPAIPDKLFLRFLSGSVRTMILAVFFAVLVLPIGHYVLVYDQFGKVVPHDLYKLPLTNLQAQQLAFIRQHI